MRWNRCLLFLRLSSYILLVPKREGFKHSTILFKIKVLHSAKKDYLSQNKMANLHVRSNSLPSKSHPMVNDVEDHLCRIRGSEATSTSATSVCSNLANLRGLHEATNNLIQMPSIQQAISRGKGEKWTIALLDESLVLVDLCGFAREVISLTKESIQELESSIRRNRGETATIDGINAYMASRKKINKMVNKCIKNLKSFDQNSTVLL